jgi:hypothetical protein
MTDLLLRDIDPILVDRIRRIAIARGWTQHQTVLNLIEHPVRRSTLIAKRSERAGKIVYSFTINLQGPEETVFFDV